MWVLRQVLGWDGKAGAFVPLDDAADIEQGFVTNRGDFVDRITAGEIALGAGQIAALGWPPELYSEDLW